MAQRASRLPAVGGGTTTGLRLILTMRWSTAASDSPRLGKGGASLPLASVAAGLGRVRLACRRARRPVACTEIVMVSWTPGATRTRR